MTCRLAIFDLDGTLADSFPWFLRVVNGVAGEFGFRRIAEDDILRLRAASARDILRELGVPLWKLPRIAAHMRAMKREAVHEIALFAGVPDMLGALHAAGIRLALVTSDSEANARVQLGAHAALFSDFACGASLFGKAAKFRRVLRNANVPPAQAIAIGDERRDAEAARAAGIAFGAVAWGYAQPSALRALSPQQWFECVGEIAPRLVPGIASGIARA